MHSFFRKAIGWMTDVTCTRFFAYITLLNVTCNIFSIFAIEANARSVLQAVSLSIILAYIESVVYHALRFKSLRITFAIAVSALMNVLAASDIFLYTRFKQVINTDNVLVFLQSNTKEASEFAASYLSAGYICLFVLGLALFNISLLLISNMIHKKRMRTAAATVAAAAFITFAALLAPFIKYGFGSGILQSCVITRFVYPIYKTSVSEDEYRTLLAVCKNVRVKQLVKKKPTVVVVIGESFSIYHSSLYGYRLNTNPLLKKRVEDGEMYLYDDAVTIFPATSNTMRAVYSLGSQLDSLAEKPIFPACFKAAGYSTCLYDNQYLTSESQEFIFLCNKDLSDYVYDKRNDRLYQYDMDMINDAPQMQDPSLCIYNLNGQHYTYKERYPESYRCFNASDYSKKYTKKQREKIAHYDNATLYNDYVANAILDRFKDKYCVVFYFSDHGEEIYDVDGWMGHGSADVSANPNYQLRVPLMVWLSPSYRKENPDMARRLKRAESYPICTDDISHCLLDVAGITCEDFDPRRSFVNDRYDTLRHRIVMKSVDYDEKIKPLR